MQPNLTIETAVETLRVGQVIAYPTEAVWGLGCDPQQSDALQRLLQLKQRSPEKGLILIGSDISDFAAYIQPPTEIILDCMRQNWPGTTLLLAKSNRCPPLVSGAYQKVAVRLTAHPIAAELCRLFGGAIVSTSANIAEQLPATSQAEVIRYFGNAVTIVPGELGTAKTVSRIIDAETGKVLR